MNSTVGENASIQRAPASWRLARWVCRNLPLRGRERLAKWVCDPHGMVDFPFTEDFYGLRYNGNLNRLLDWHVFFFGALSLNELETIATIVPVLSDHHTGPLVAWDIGGNLGHHSLFMSTLFDQTHTFEPVPSNIEIFKSRVADNNITSITLHEMALGKSEGTATIHYPPPDRRSNSGTASLFDDYNSENNLLSHDVSVSKGDDLIQNGEIPKPRFIKIDVEGFEWEVLQGLTDLIKNDLPIIMSEMSDRSWRETDQKAFMQLFDNYTLFEVGINRWTRKVAYSEIKFGKSDEVLLVPNRYEQLINAIRNF